MKLRLETVLAKPLSWFFSGLRAFFNTKPKFYAALGSRRLQPLLKRISTFKAWILVTESAIRCPAYRQHLASHGFNPRRLPKLSCLPETSKENYIKQYPLKERTRTGKLPHTGVVIDESSGSSGHPTNWIRGAHERNAVSRALQLACGMMHGNRRIFVLNCFALGPWATGMNISMSVTNVSWLKSIGPDTSKVDATLREFGPEFRYLLTGYPPFIKRFLDETKADLSQYDIHLVLGGEGNSEGLRDYFQSHFSSVYSSYGASDLEINIGMETDLTIALRRACLKSPERCERLFGSIELPMIFQYNPLDYLIETNRSGEMLFTVLRHRGLIPKIRYNLRDRGRAMSFEMVEGLLGESLGDYLPATARRIHFPFLFVFGRTDLTVPFFGANIYASDLERVINDHPKLVRRVHSFRLATGEDNQFDNHLIVSLELACSENEFSQADLQTWVYQGLQKVNQDFREVSQMFPKERIRVTCFALGTGPFQSSDIRLKQNYLSRTEAKGAGAGCRSVGNAET